MLSRCSICDGRCRPVQGDGPEPCDVLFIGERPGGEENRIGRPFIGPYGREFNQNYLWLAGLRRENIRITNAVKCFADGNRKPTEKEIRGCADHHLPEEIERANPSVIVLLGGTACSLVPDIDLDIEHGIPRHADIYGWSGVVVPMYHPAAGLHDTGKMIPLLEDFERLREVLDGSWSAPVDPYPNPDYRLIRDWWDFDRFMNLTIDANREHKLLAIDTERHGEDAFSVQFSCKPGTGYMMLWSDRVIERVTGQKQTLWEGMRAWIYRIQRHHGWEIVLHNAPQDLDWLDRMGIKVTRFRDTMQEAYHQGNLPQGLKALVYRLFGIRMTTYEDVVIPHSREAVGEWIIEAMVYAGENLRYVEHKQLKTKIKTINKPGEIERGLQRIYRYAQDSRKYDPWEKLAELFGKDVLSAEEKRFVESTRGPRSSAHAVVSKLTGSPGPIPIAGIGNVPIEKAVKYGCADADMTLRTAIELERRREMLTGTGGRVVDRMGMKSWIVADGDEDK